MLKTKESIASFIKGLENSSFDFHNDKGEMVEITCRKGLYRITTKEFTDDISDFVKQNRKSIEKMISGL